MKQKSFVVVLAVVLTAFGAARAQMRANVSAKDAKEIVITKVPEVAVFLASTALDGGVIPDHVFDSLACLPITARDKSGRPAQVVSYTLTFAERTLAEDSAGNPMLAVDYFSEVCNGDTLNAVLRNNLFDRTKPGDTVWYERIQVATAAGQTGGKTMKFVLSR
jgi:hypothetical protein